MPNPFHIAFPVNDIDAAREFYGTVLECPEGRSSENWIDFDLYGHQIVAHYKPPTGDSDSAAHHNPVDGHDVPVPQFRSRARLGSVAAAGGQAAIAQRRIRDRTVHSIRRRTRRTRDDVLSRPSRQRSGIQSVQRYVAVVRNVELRNRDSEYKPEAPERKRVCIHGHSLSRPACGALPTPSDRTSDQPLASVVATGQRFLRCATNQLRYAQRQFR